jgi:cytoskeletal protein CcmA (bactofilin family)
MRPVRLRFALWCLGVLLGAASGLSTAQQFGESVVQRGRVAEDLYVAGGTVSVAAQVEGDVTAAGGQVTIDDSVSGDVMAFGGTLTLRARVGDDARLAGGEVDVAGTTAGDLLVAGGSVRLAPGAAVGGRAWLAGGTLEIAGRVTKSLQAAGGEIVIASEILGDTDLIADTIEIRPGAVIHGQLRYRSPKPASIAPGARVLGGVIVQPLESPPAHTGAGGGVFMLLSLSVTALALYLLFPRFAPAAARGVREAPWAALGLGLAVLAAGPLVVVLLLASVVGLWLGLVTLFMYLALLLLGYLTGVLFAADAGLRLLRRHAEPTRGWMIGAILAVLVVLSLLRLVPALGALAALALLLFGLGALTRALWRRYAGGAGG